MNIEKLRELDNFTLTELFINSGGLDPEIQQAILDEVSRRGAFLPITSTTTSPLLQERRISQAQEFINLPTSKKAFKLFLRGATLGLLGGRMPHPEDVKDDPFFKPFIDENHPINKFTKLFISDYGLSPAGLSEATGFFFVPGAILKGILGKLGVRGLNKGILGKALGEGGWGISRYLGEKGVQFISKFTAPVAERITGLETVNSILSKIPAGLRNLTARTLKEGAILSVPFGIWHASLERDKAYWEGKPIDSTLGLYFGSVLQTALNPLTYLIALPVAGIQGYLGTREALLSRGEAASFRAIMSKWWQYGDLAQFEKNYWKSIARDLAEEISIMREQNALTPEVLNDAIQRFWYGETKFTSGKPSDILNLKKVLDLDETNKFLPPFIREELSRDIGSAVKFLSDLTANPENTQRIFEYAFLKNPDFLRYMLERPLSLKGVEIGGKFYTKFETTWGEYLLGSKWEERLSKLISSLDKSLSKLESNTEKIGLELLKNDELRREMLLQRGFPEELASLPLSRVREILTSSDFRELAEDIMTAIQGSPDILTKILNANKTIKEALNQREQILNNINKIYQIASNLSSKISSAIYQKEYGTRFLSEVLNEIGFNIDALTRNLIEGYKRGFQGILGNNLTSSDLAKIINELSPQAKQMLLGNLPTPIFRDFSKLLTSFDKSVDFYRDLEAQNRSLSLVWQPILTSAELYWKKIEDLAKEKALQMFVKRRASRPISLPEDIEALNRAYKKWSELKGVSEEFLTTTESKKLFEKYLKTKGGKQFLDEELNRQRMEKIDVLEEKIANDVGKTTKSVVENIPQIQEKLKDEEVVKELTEKTFTMEPPAVVDKNLYRTKVSLTSFEEVIEPLQKKLIELGDEKTAKLLGQLSEEGKMRLFISLMGDLDEILFSLKAYREFGKLTETKKIDTTITKYINGLALSNEEREIINSAKNFILSRFGSSLEDIDGGILQFLNKDIANKLNYYLQTGFLDDISKSLPDMEMREAKNLEDIQKNIDLEPEKKPKETTIKSPYKLFRPQINNVLEDKLLSNPEKLANILPEGVRIVPESKVKLPQKMSTISNNLDTTIYKIEEEPGWLVTPRLILTDKTPEEMKRVYLVEDKLSQSTDISREKVIDVLNQFQSTKDENLIELFNIKLFPGLNYKVLIGESSKNVVMMNAEKYKWLKAQGYELHLPDKPTEKGSLPILKIKRNGKYTGVVMADFVEQDIQEYVFEIIKTFYKEQ